MEKTRDARTPLYQRIKQEIADRIRSEQLAPGEFLPTRTELAEHYQTTKATVDRAILELVREGVVSGGSGRRSSVNLPAQVNARSIAVVWTALEEHISFAGSDFFEPLISGIRQACAEFMLEVHFRAAQGRAYEEMLKETGAQGLLALRPDYSDVPALEALSQRGTPIVSVPGILEAGHIRSVSSDNYMGMEQAVSHLVELGHRHIGFVCLTATIPDHFERLQGFLNAMATHNLPVQPGAVYLAHAIHTDEFTELCRKWANLTRMPTAVITSDFLMGLGLLRSLNEIGMRVPQDISVINFDDPPAAAHLVPAMTVVRQEVGQLAYRGVERLVQQIQGQDAPLVDRVPTTLVVRESTTHPR